MLANRTAHVTVGVILAFAYVPIEFFIINEQYPFTWIHWVTAILLAIVGSEGPDLDQLYSFMSHRDVVTHSALYPGIIFGVCLWWRLTVNSALISCFIPFLLAYGSHLFLDYFPRIQVKDMLNKGIRISEKRGTFLMHVPFVYKTKEGKERKTLNVKQTERWLMFNAFLCVVMAVFLAVTRFIFDVSTIT
ncbi:MAG: hypothetical protein GF308_04030 [Candidatus Heimdallarchaeota archaeon]|nr:hypothetical protein [Candidatus Heimdallarchaeota archaeon]